MWDKDKALDAQRLSYEAKIETIIEAREKERIRHQERVDDLIREKHEMELEFARKHARAIEALYLKVRRKKGEAPVATPADPSATLNLLTTELQGINTEDLLRDS